MRAIPLFLASAVLLSTMATAQAETGPTEMRRATAQQMDQVSGAYQLSDGRRADIVILDYRLYVQIGKAQRKELLLSGPDRFATRDGSIAIQFGPELATDNIVLAHDRDIAPPQDTIRLASNQRIGRGGID
jgi:hypothetical protein